jgi:hypothetical protein
MGSMRGFLRKIANPQIPQNNASYWLDKIKLIHDK